MNVAYLPRRWISAATCFPPSSFISRITAIKSFSAKRFATARPIPDAAPVTTAILSMATPFCRFCIYLLYLFLTPYPKRESVVKRAFFDIRYLRDTGTPLRPAASVRRLRWLDTPATGHIYGPQPDGHPG